ncbi:MAG: hypothetical protein ABIJ56_03600 [Pseudomonadota bacterium]
MLALAAVGCDGESDDGDGTTDVLDILHEDTMDMDSSDPIADVMDVVDFVDDDLQDAADVPLEDSPPPTCDDVFDPLNPDMKVIFLDIFAPANLDNVILENLIQTSIDSGNFIWPFQFNGVDDGTTDNDGTMSLLTGAGQEVEGFEGCFAFMDEPEWAPAGANMNITGNDMSWPDGEPEFDITVPIFEADGETVFIEFPISHLMVESGTFSEDRTAMGSLTDCTTSGGRIAGAITVDDAKGVVIEAMGLTLCGLLSGDKGTNLSDPSDDCLLPEETWPERPDIEVEGRSAYTLNACFSAEQVIIIED